MKSRFAAAVLLSAVAASAHAQVRSPGLVFDFEGWNSPVEGTRRLEDVKLDASRTPAGVRVITERAVRESGARNLQELLRREAGVNQFDSIGNSHQGTVDLRGFNATPVPAVAVMVDGVRVNEADFGQVNLHLIPIEEIERVEIVPGPGTMHGRGAMSGVIRVTTKRAKDRFAAEAGASFGSFDRRRSWTSMSGTAGRFDFRASGSRELDGGWRDHSSARLGAASLQAGYKNGEDLDISLGYRRSDDSLQQPGSLVGTEIAQDPRQYVSHVDMVNKTDFFVYRHRQALPYGLTLAMNAHLRERREATPLNQGRTSVSESMSVTNSRGATAQLSRELELLGRRVVPTLGGEYSATDADTRSSGAFGASPFQSGSLAKDDTSSLFGQAAADIIPGTLIVTGGLRYDQSKVRYEDKYKPNKNGAQFFHRTSSQLGLNLNLGDSVQTYASYGESFRTPTVNEISALGPFSQGRLDPVKARNWEAGFRARMGGTSKLHASIFRTDVRDEIYFDPTQGAFGRNVNVDKTRRQGVEWGLEAAAGRWEGRLSHAFTEATFESAFTLSGTPWPAQQSVRPGNAMPMVPKHRGSAGLAFRPAKGWRLSADENCTGSQYLVGDEANDRAQLPGYCTTDLGASFEKGGWRFFVNGFNVLDSRHQVRGIISKNPATGLADRFLVPGAGISVQGGMSCRFSLRRKVAAQMALAR